MLGWGPTGVWETKLSFCQLWLIAQEITFGIKKFISIFSNQVGTKLAFSFLEKGVVEATVEQLPQSKCPATDIVWWQSTANNELTLG